MADPTILTQARFHTTPFSASMPPMSVIDPSLAIDPAILGESSISQQGFQPPLAQQSFQEPPFYIPNATHMEHVPDGDPFAPQVNHTSVLPQIPSPPRNLKRKRKHRLAAKPDKECSFCQGDNTHNKAGYFELMVSCFNCGRSGHPSCLDIESMANVLHTYPWYCIECKICEVCEKKSNGDRMLFCDACDRGWHMDCLDPPLDSTPNGSWTCPLCPPIPPLPPEQVDPNVKLDLLEGEPSAHPLIPDTPMSKDDAKNTARSRSGNKERNTSSEIGEKHHRRSRVLNGTRQKGKGKVSTAETIPIGSRSPTQRKVRLLVRTPNKGVVVEEEGDGEEESDGDDEEGQEEQEEPSHMFEGILTREQHCVRHTSILDSDKILFNKARVRAESKLGPPIAPPLPSGLLTPGPPTPSTPTPVAGPSTNISLLHSLRTRQAAVQAQQINASLDSYLPLAPDSHKVPHPPRIRTIRFGGFDIDTWYDAPFPEEYASVHDGKLWICEFCLKYMKSRYQSTRHKMKCKARHPPGDEIYRDGSISIFEVDGRKNKIYCQNLCLLSKMFLDHKSLFYDVEPFLFYVMAEVDQLGARFVGYFSKEKRSPKNYNVSCIMTLPVRQRKGWGSALIDFSYCLSKKEGRLGSPERPLSALGALTYKRYWAHAIRLFLHTATDPVKMEDICRATSMTLEDVYNTLQDLKYINVQDRPCQSPRPPPGTPIKYLRGRKIGSGISRRLPRMKRDDSKDGPVIPTEYQIVWDSEEIESYVNAWRAKDHIKINPRFLKWSPFILAKLPETATEEDPDVAQGHAKRETVLSRPPKSDGTSALAASLKDIALSELGRHPNAVSESSGREGGSSADGRSASGMDVDEELLTHVSADSSRKSKSSSSWRKSQRPDSTEERRSASVIPNAPRLRTLRPRSHMKRNGKADQNDQPPFSEQESDQEDTDGADDAKENQFRRITRSSGRFESPKTRTPNNKRRRINTPSSTDTEDVDGSLSALTHGSSSPPTPSPPRRSTRSEKTKVANQGVNGGSKKADMGRVTRSHPQAAEMLALSPIADGIGISVPKEFERRNVRHTRQAVHVHSETDAECIPVNGPASNMVDVDMADVVPEEENNHAADDQVPKSAVSQINGIVSNGSTPGIFNDEDGLGDEDAEGEEDLNPSDDY